MALQLLQHALHAMTFGKAPDEQLPNERSTSDAPRLPLA